MNLQRASAMKTQRKSRWQAPSPPPIHPIVHLIVRISSIKFPNKNPLQHRSGWSTVRSATHTHESPSRFAPFSPLSTAHSRITMENYYYRVQCLRLARIDACKTYISNSRRDKSLLFNSVLCMLCTVVLWLGFAYRAII